MTTTHTLAGPTTGTITLATLRGRSTPEALVALDPDLHEHLGRLRATLTGAEAPGLALSPYGQAFLATEAAGPHIEGWASFFAPALAFVLDVETEATSDASAPDPARCEKARHDLVRVNAALARRLNLAGARL